MHTREDFEKLPHILCLMQYVTCFDGLKYVSDNQYLADYLNGAWDTYQVQQVEVDKRLSDCQLEVSQVGQACVQWKEVVEGKQAEIDALKAKIDEFKSLLRTVLDEYYITDYYNPNTCRSAELLLLMPSIYTDDEVKIEIQEILK